MSSRDAKTRSLREFRKLAARPERITLQRVWRALLPAERMTSALTMAEEGADEFEKLATEVAEQRSFRRATVLKWPKEKITALCAGITISNNDLCSDLLLYLHMPERSELLVTLLNALGVPNDGGIADQQNLDAASPTDQEMEKGIRKLLDGFDERLVLTYLTTLVAKRITFAGALQRWLRDQAIAQPHSEGRDDSAEPDDASSETLEESRIDQLTTLDKQVIHAIVDAAKRIDNALDEDEADDLVEELLHISGRRHQSYFHAGLRDVLFNRDLGVDLSETNEPRARWYWAGVVQGFTRTQRWAEIVEVADASKIVMKLGNGQDGASHAAALHLARAFHEVGRAAENASLIRTEALERYPSVFLLLLEQGTELLRVAKPDEAKGILDLLVSVIPNTEEAAGKHSPRAFLEARRRQAHCLRQLGDFAGARTVLEQLLAQDTDQNVRAMLLTDLGLINGAFKRLSDVRVPKSPGAAKRIRDALEKGIGEFQEAVEANVHYSGHGRYCLGIAALIDGDFGAAIEHLEQARSLFLSRPKRYEGGGLIETAETALGIALCHGFKEERLRDAAEMIKKGITSGIEIQYELVEGALTALTYASANPARRFAEALLESGHESAFEAVTTSGIAMNSAAILDAILERASNTQHTSSSRAAYYRRAVPRLTAQCRNDDLGVVLDALEELALLGTGEQEFVNLLTEASQHEPAWSLQEALVARAHVLESLGQRDEAATLLTSEFYRILGGDGYSAIPDAEGILERVKGLETGADLADRLQASLDAKKEAQKDEYDSSNEPRAPTPVQVLWIGGDERQEKQEKALKKDLSRIAPHVDVTFIRSGWSGNWQPFAEEFSRRLIDHDAVVVMRYIRTNLGRQVRKECGSKPWRFCWGAGRKQAVLAITAAADAASASE